MLPQSPYRSYNDYEPSAFSFLAKVVVLEVIVTIFTPLTEFYFSTLQARHLLFVELNSSFVYFDLKHLDMQSSLLEVYFYLSCCKARVEHHFLSLDKMGIRACLVNHQNV